MATAEHSSPTTTECNDTEAVDLPDRTQRALEQYITITPDIGRAAGADDLVLATSESGSSYLVDLQSNTCECPDSEHRDPTLGCKHLRRARFALGRWPIPGEGPGGIPTEASVGRPDGGFWGRMRPADGAADPSAWILYGPGTTLPYGERYAETERRHRG